MDELRTALELATEEELQDLTAILFGRKFNPLDYVHTPEPIEVQSQDHKAWLDALEGRFRFLAADGMTVLRGRTNLVTYREALIQVCKYLKIRYYHQLATVDLEAEVFLHLLGHVWKKLPEKEKQKLTVQVQEQLAKSELDQPLPLSLQRDPLGLLFKGGSALAVTSIIQPLLLKQIARQFAMHFATYQIAQQAAVEGGVIATTQFQNYVALQMAQRGMAVSAARYTAVRSVFAMLGPVMWGWFFADLGWRAIATNYGRIIPTIFALAQIRLTRNRMLGTRLKTAFRHPNPNLQFPWSLAQVGLFIFPLSPFLGAVTLGVASLKTWLRQHQTIIRRPLIGDLPSSVYC